MRIAFLTDLHLGLAGQRPLSVDVRQNFLDALDFLTELKPDVLVIGGDVCYDTGEAEIYRWFREQVAARPYPWYAIAGNHDSSPLMARELGLEAHLHGEEVYFSTSFGDTTALFLDTAKGVCSETQWTWLRARVAELQGGEALIFMHHPPVPAGVEYMDTNYPFRESEKFLETIQPLRRVTVVCGHYHAEQVVQRGDLTVFLTPSLFFQMKHDPAECVFDHFRMGIREINLGPEGLTTAVHYLDGNRTHTAESS